MSLSSCRNCHVSYCYYRVDYNLHLSYYVNYCCEGLNLRLSYYVLLMYYVCAKHLCRLSGLCYHSKYFYYAHYYPHRFVLPKNLFDVAGLYVHRLLFLVVVSHSVRFLQ